jgi:hypothetical protein
MGITEGLLKNTIALPLHPDTLIEGALAWLSPLQDSSVIPPRGLP